MIELRKRNVQVVNHSNGQLVDFPTLGKHIDEDTVTEIQNDISELNYKTNALSSGTPTAVETVAEMTDTAKLYIYMGSESGYTSGHWYYYDGSAWTDGGAYGYSQVDSSLTVQGAAAEAKATGNRIISVVEYNMNKTPTVVEPEETEADLYVSDEYGNVIAEFSDGHIKTKNFDSETSPSAEDLDAVESDVQSVTSELFYKAETKSSTAENADLDVVDATGNVLARFSDGHIKTKYFDSSRADQNAVKTVNNTAPDSEGNVDVTAQLNPTELQNAVDTYLTEHPVVAAAAGIVSVADYGAVGDGVTDDSAAIQNAVNSNYDVYFESDKTYYLGSTVTINHDIKLHGGRNTVIKTATPDNAAPYDGISVSGTLKDTTTFTSNYYAEGTDDVDNISNRLTLTDMSNVAIGDILIIRATDQYYSYSRRYYYLGAVLLVTDIYDGHIYVNRNMPWDIILSDSVAVYVYSAPTLRITNLYFESDLNVFGGTYYNSYAALVQMSYCKNAVFSNCNFNHMKIGIKANYCVNCRFEDVTMSKSRYENTDGLGDGYGIALYSCTNTVIDRMLSLCAQGCIDLGGDVPNIDTFVFHSDLSSECRAIGIDMHDNSYNIVIEDCVLGGLSLFGTAIINRCEFIRNLRGGGYGGVTFRGFADKRWSRLHVTDCVFPENASCYISLKPQIPQDYVQACDSIIDSVVVENCRGGGISYEVSTSAFTLSNTVNRLVLRNWKDCNEIYHNDGGVIKQLEVEDCTFIVPKYINRHSGTFDTSGIYNVLTKRNFPVKNMLIANVNGTYGERYTLPEGIEIAVSSDDPSAKYIVCGENLASDDSADYSAGAVSSTVGNAMTRTIDATATAFISSDGSGGLIYTVPSEYSTKRIIYPNCMIHANTDEDMLFSVSMTVKNTGDTDGGYFRPYIVIIDCETGLVTYSGHGNSGQATANGLELSHSYKCPKGHAVFWYLHNYIVTSGSETTIKNAMVSLTSYDKSTPTYKAYNANKITGDGTLTSISGQNNIQSTSETFNVAFTVDYVE